MMRELSVHGCFDFRFYASSIKPGGLGCVLCPVNLIICPLFI